MKSFSQRTASNLSSSMAASGNVGGSNLPGANSDLHLLEGKPEVYHLHRNVLSNTNTNTIVDDEFQGPPITPIELPPEDNPSRISGVPVYLGPDGTFYDLDYTRVPEGPSSNNGAQGKRPPNLPIDNVYDTKALAAHQPRPARSLGDLYRSFPDPTACTSYEDLEARLLAWHKDMEQALGYVVRPRVMGRCYARPKVATDETAASAMNDAQQAQGQPQQGQMQQMQHVLREDPWEATLIPPEPNPHFYEDYDQYELAMKRWYAECCRVNSNVMNNINNMNSMNNNIINNIGVKRMLPHPAQLKGMQTLKLQPAKEVFSIARNLGFGDSADKAADSFSFVGVVPGYKNPYIRDRSAAEADAAARTLPLPPPPPAEFTLKVGQRYREEMRKAAQQNDPIAAAAENTAKCAEDELEKALDRLIAAAEQNSGEYGVTNRPIAVVQGSDAYDTHVDLKRLEETLANPLQSAYPLEIRAEYERLQNTWKARERAALTLDTDETRAFFFDYLRGETVGAARVAQAIKVPMSFGQFGRVMETKLADGRTAYAALSDTIGAEEFPEVLAQWDLSRDPSVLEKLAFFVCELVKRTPSCTTNVFHGTPSHATCAALYTLARCAYFATPAQPDIYPFAEETMTMVERCLLSEAEVLKMEQPALCVSTVLAVFHWYYLELVNAALRQETTNAALAAVERSIIAALHESPKIIVVLFHCLVHRSVTISGPCLFVLTRLLHSPNREFSAILTDPSANLCGELQLLCFLKLSHVQFAVRRLTDILLTETWRQTLFAHFGPGNQLILPFVVLNSSSADTCGVTQTYAEFVERIYNNCYDIAQNPAVAARQPWAFGTSLFNDLCSGISECIRVGLYYGAAALARVLDTLCLTSFKLKVIDTEGQRMGSALALTVTQENIDTLVGYVNALSKKNDMATYPVSAPVLSAVRILLRHQLVYTEYKGKEKLIQSILGFCKDGKDSDFNRQAWKMFYEIIEYHAGAIEFMDSVGVLSQFTELLGTTVNGTTVTIHSIKYFRKVLELGSSEQGGRNSARREDKKSIEKDIKFFTNFFKEKHLFVQFHITYKNQASMCGAVFYEVAQVYQKLQVLPETQKLLKDILKNPDYRKGLQDIHEMFPPN